MGTDATPRLPAMPWIPNAFPFSRTDWLMRVFEAGWYMLQKSPINPIMIPYANIDGIKKTRVESRPEPNRKRVTRRRGPNLSARKPAGSDPIPKAYEKTDTIIPR